MSWRCPVAAMMGATLAVAAVCLLPAPLHEANADDEAAIRECQRVRIEKVQQLYLEQARRRAGGFKE